MTIQAYINGLTGRMGKEIQKILTEGSYPIKLAAGWSANTQLSDDFRFPPGGINLILDFSVPAGNLALFKFLERHYSNDQEHEIAVLLGTTGLGDGAIKKWQELAGRSPQMRVLLAPNTSIGIYQLAKSSQEIAGHLSKHGFDIEICETHHRNKLDAPSGTAKYLINQIIKKLPEYSSRTSQEGRRPEKTIGVSVMRGGGVLGEHLVRFISEEEEVFIGHRAFSRTLFAKGAITLAQWLVQQKRGFFQLEDISL